MTAPITGSMCSLAIGLRRSAARNSSSSDGSRTSERLFTPAPDPSARRTTGGFEDARSARAPLVRQWAPVSSRCRTAWDTAVVSQPQNQNRTWPIAQPCTLVHHASIPLSLRREIDPAVSLSQSPRLWPAASQSTTSLPVGRAAVPHRALVPPSVSPPP
eukprot:3941519-Rhodomonas_salina.3